MHANAEEMTLDKLAAMVQVGFLDMGDRFDRVEGRLDGVEGRLDGVEGRLERVEGTLVKVIAEFREIRDDLSVLPTASMHRQLAGRVSAIEGHLGV